MKNICPICIFAAFFFHTSGYAQKSYKVSYHHSADISDKYGVPKDSLTFYFPIEYFYDSIHLLNYTDPKTKLRMDQAIDGGCDTREELSKRLNIPVNEFVDSYQIIMDSFSLSWYSVDLFKMNEPVLYNNFLEREIYRFTWLRSFHRPVVIRIMKSGDHVSIITKELQREPKGDYSDENGNHVIFDNNIPPFAINKTKPLSKKQFQDFLSLIDSVNLFSIPHFSYHPCSVISDGAEWIFETQSKDGYSFIIRTSPEKNSPLRVIGELMIRLSEVRNEKIY